MRKCTQAFTLAELLVSVAVLIGIVLLVNRLFIGMMTITTAANKRMDLEAQVRPLFERVAVDFAQMVKRRDTDFFGKGTAAPNSTGGTMIGNDQIAFYSSVAGYHASGVSPSSISLVAYRIGGNKLERVAKGLLWNGVSSSDTPIVFLPVTISAKWPGATDLSASPTPNSDAELIAPHVFRFEDDYLLKNGLLSDTPWDSALDHHSVDGLQDVAAISIVIAAVDPKSGVLISTSQLAALTERLIDFSPSMRPGDLLNQWQVALDATTDIPRPAISGVRIYERYFYLLPR